MECESFFRHILTLNRLWFYDVKNSVALKGAWILGKTTFGTTVSLPKDSNNSLLAPIDPYMLLILLEM